MTDSPVSAYDAALEVMARAYYEWTCVNPGEPSLWAENSASGEQARSFARARAEVMLDAALVAREHTTCPTCGGHGVVIPEWEEFDEFDPSTYEPCPNPTCDGSGTVPGSRLIDALAVFVAGEGTP